MEQTTIPRRVLAVLAAAMLLSSLALAAVAAPVGAADPRCASKSATIVGTDKSETIRGTGGDDVIVAGGGADTVRGQGGRDLVCGGAGKDQLYGNAGRDKLFGEPVTTASTAEPVWTPAPRAGVPVSVSTVSSRARHQPQHRFLSPPRHRLPRRPRRQRLADWSSADREAAKSARRSGLAPEVRAPGTPVTARATRGRSTTVRAASMSIASPSSSLCPPCHLDRPS
jgi:hypothetical protein